jgi:hypothetical protein
MPINQEALRKACRDVADSTLWQTPKPVDISDIIDTDQIAQTTQDYFDEAMRHVEYVDHFGRDPNLVVRAVRYLAHAHAIPPMKQDLTWFRNMLEAAIELACPNSIHTPESAEFFDDIEEGIRDARENAETPEGEQPD